MAQSDYLWKKKKKKKKKKSKSAQCGQEEIQSYIVIANHEYINVHIQCTCVILYTINRHVVCTRDDYPLTIVIAMLYICIGRDNLGLQKNVAAPCICVILFVQQMQMCVVNIDKIAIKLKLRHILHTTICSLAHSYWYKLYIVYNCCILKSYNANVSSLSNDKFWQDIFCVVLFVLFVVVFAIGAIT